MMVCQNVERTQHLLPQHLDGEETLRRVELRVERFFPCEVTNGRRKKLPRSRHVEFLRSPAQQSPWPPLHWRLEQKQHLPIAESTMLIGIHVDRTP